MDIESLKQVVEILKGLGSEAREVVIIYLIATKLPGVIFGAIWTGVGCFVITRVLAFARSYVSGDRMRNATGVSIYSWDTDKVEKACAILRREWNKEEPK